MFEPLRGSRRLFVTLCFLLSSLVATPIIVGQSAPAPERVADLVRAYEASRYEEAAYGLAKIIPTLDRASETITLAKAQTFYAESLYEIEREEEALTWFRRSYQTVITQGLDSTRLDFFHLILQGMGACYSASTPEGISWYRRMTAFVERYRPQDRKAWAESRYNESLISANQGDFKTAIKLLETSLAEGKPYLSQLDLFSSYNNLAIFNSIIGRNDLALANQRLATTHAYSPVTAVESRLNESYYYFPTRDNTVAWRTLDKAAQILRSDLSDSSELWMAYFDRCAYLLNQEGDNDGFLRIQARQERYYNTYPERKVSEQYQRYCNYRASFFLRNRDTERAEKWLERAAAVERQLGLNWELYTSRLLITAKLLGAKNQFAEAARYFYLLLAYESGLPTNPANSLDVHHDFSQDSLPATVNTVALLKDRAALYSRWAIYELGEGYDILALREIRQADQLVARALDQVADETGWLQLEAQSYELRRVALSVYWTQHQCLPTGYETEQAIQASERIKHLGISQRLIASHRKDLAGAPLDLLRTERIMALKHDELLRQLRQPGLSSAAVAGLRGQIKQVLTDRRQTRQQLRQLAPGFMRERYFPKDISLQQIRQDLLADNEVMLNFVDQDSFVYVMLIGADTSAFRMLRQREPLSQSVPALLDDLRNYRQAAYPRLRRFYQELLTPLEPFMAGKDLVIVPDGQLNYLPFAALLSSEVDTISQSAQEYPYLLRSHRIRHLFNCQVGLTTGSRKTSWLPYDIVAFAPFEERGDDSFPALPFSKTTLQNLERDAGWGEALTYSDTLATLAAFRRSVAGANLLHIGTHAEINNENAANSALLFTPDTSGRATRLLSARIPRLELQTDLVVLSSCQSADGQLYEGRGVANFAQAFAYAGATNIVVNLWEIRDETAYRLLTPFYTALLSEGTGKADALRQAQLQYLYTSEKTAHPGYWATTIYIGDKAPLRSNVGWYQRWVWAGVLVFSLVFTVLIWRWWRRENV